jgi:hypothetical protein
MFDVEDFTTSYFRRDRLGDAGDASQDASLRLDAGLVVRDRAVSWSVISKGSISAMSFDSSTASTRAPDRARGRGRGRVRLLEVGLADARPRQEVAADVAAVAQGRLADGHGVVDEVVLQREDALLVLVARVRHKGRVATIVRPMRASCFTVTPSCRPMMGFVLSARRGEVLVSCAGDRSVPYGASISAAQAQPRRSQAQD